MSLRGRVWDRDQGVCSRCGFQSGPLRRRLLYLFWEDRPEFERLRAQLKIPRTRAAVGSVWDVHHVLPRCMGGTNDLENLVTVCLWCHRGETRRMLRRKAYGCGA